jgi:hypothetical protein
MMLEIEPAQDTSPLLRSGSTREWKDLTNLPTKSSGIWMSFTSVQRCDSRRILCDLERCISSCH